MTVITPMLGFNLKELVQLFPCQVPSKPHLRLSAPRNPPRPPQHCSRQQQPMMALDLGNTAKDFTGKKIPNLEPYVKLASFNLALSISGETRKALKECVIDIFDLE